MIAIIDFTPAAKENALSLREILIVRGDKVTARKPYTETEVKSLLREGYFIFDRTLGLELPEESRLVPDYYKVLGRIQTHKAPLQ